MRRFGYPVAALIVGAILGRLAELQLRRTLDISAGELTALVASPVAAIVYSFLAVVLHFRLEPGDRAQDSGALYAWARERLQDPVQDHD